MRNLLLLALLASCESAPAKQKPPIEATPAPIATKPSPPPAVAPVPPPPKREGPIGEQVTRGRVVLYERRIVKKLDAYDPVKLPDIRSFYIDISRDDDGNWDGILGEVPLGGCCIEPTPVAEPTFDGTVWTIKGREARMWSCGDDEPSDLVIAPRADGDFDVTCGAKKVVLAIVKPVDERKKEWERARIDDMFAAARDARIQRTGTQWTFEGTELKSCVVLAHECKQTALVASCAIDASRVLRVRGRTVTIVNGESAFHGAGRCAKGVLSGVD
jgi:hypothetical protein